MDTQEIYEDPLNTTISETQFTSTSKCWAVLAPSSSSTNVPPKELIEDEVVIGRNSSCGVRLEDRRISSRHAKVYREPYGTGLYKVFIVDLSTNGTFVDRKRISKNTPVKLHTGAEISLSPPDSNTRIAFLFQILDTSYTQQSTTTTTAAHNVSQNLNNTTPQNDHQLADRNDKRPHEDETEQSTKKLRIEQELKDGEKGGEHNNKEKEKENETDKEGDKGGAKTKDELVPQLKKKTSQLNLNDHKEEDKDESGGDKKDETNEKGKKDETNEKDEIKMDIDDKKTEDEAKEKEETTKKEKEEAMKKGQDDTLEKEKEETVAEVQAEAKEKEAKEKEAKEKEAKEKEEKEKEEKEKEKEKKEKDKERGEAEIEEHLVCGICQSLFHKCVSVIPCLHNFCAACIGEWVARSNKCPECRHNIKGISKNHIINNVVGGFLQVHPDKCRPPSELEDMDKSCKITEKMLQKGKLTGLAGWDNREEEEEDEEYDEDEELSEEDTANTCRQCRAPGADGFQCPPHGPHLTCSSCTQLVPDRAPSTDPAHPIPRVRCELCLRVHCDLYWGCSVFYGKGALKALTDYQFTAIPPHTILNNAPEVQYTLDILNFNNISGGANGLWHEILKDLDSAKLQFNTIPTHINVTSSKISCSTCARTVFESLVYRWRAAVPANKIPPLVANRPNCHWGKNCRTQQHKLDHATKFNHICEQTKF